MATLKLVLGLILPLILASAHAQFDFCANGPSRYVKNDASVIEEIKTTFVTVGDESIPRVADSEHDLVEGNCTGEIGEPIIVNDDCLEPNPFGVGMHGHGYLFSDKVIVCIKVVDRSEDGTGGYPSISTGGVGKTSLELLFVSQPFTALKFYTEIYTKYQPGGDNDIM